MIRSLVGGSLLLPGIVSQMLAEEEGGAGKTAADRAAAENVNPLAPRAPHFPGKAKRVIVLHMSGGVSHLDTFDPKPRLIADGGKPDPRQRQGKGEPPKLLAPHWAFKPYGRSGIEVSDLFPHVGGAIDDICLIRSMHGDHPDHFQATLGVHTGSVTGARPCLGSWVSYGLGTVNQNLPSFVVLAPELPYAGSQVWSSDFLPGCHQGTRLLAGAEPIPNLVRRAPSAEIQQMELELLGRINGEHQRLREADAALAARIKSFETAFGMQREMPEALDLTKETDATLRLYGLERGSTQGFAWQCLVARRLIERNVRFVELIDSGSDGQHNWDSHDNIQTHEPVARNVDRPIAGLLADLKSRGLFDDTLIVWTSEFGRTPHLDGPKGRGHQASAYCSWLAGAGVKRGVVHGRTDDYGAEVVDNPVHVHDLHATILHLLGFDHKRLTFRHAGRDFRLTDVSGNVIHDLLT